MRRIAILLIGLTMLVSCQKEDKNGDLGGYWKLLQIELADNDSIIDTRSEKRFWAIQLELIQVGSAKGRFQHVGDSLFVQMITTDKNIEKYGLFNPKDERFGVLHLDRNAMILRSEKATLTLKKF